MKLSLLASALFASVAMSTSCDYIACGDSRESNCGSKEVCAPPGAYLLPSTVNVERNGLVLIENNDYMINLGVDTPMRIRWGSDSVMLWDVNATESPFIFSPGSIIASLPETADPSNNNTISSSMAWYIASRTQTFIKISKPEDSHGFFISTFLLVQPADIGELLWGRGRQNQYLYNKWKLGVGIGVGLGVPILMAVTAWVVWTLAKKRLSRQPGKDIAMSATPGRE
ncbi:hypothetical protein F5Y17DRAFT_322784 [Xylariaceae sp. FL0594]|nr:hypothetical protein F5Y17DRAFT_322784 [Xylariaceae sp. FL0594]